MIAAVDRDGEARCCGEPFIPCLISASHGSDEANPRMLEASDEAVFLWRTVTWSGSSTPHLCRELQPADPGRRLCADRGCVVSL
jgi:hypothetical protein